MMFHELIFLSSSLKISPLYCPIIALTSSLQIIKLLCTVSILTPCKHLLIKVLNLQFLTILFINLLILSTNILHASSIDEITGVLLLIINKLCNFISTTLLPLQHTCPSTQGRLYLLQL